LCGVPFHDNKGQTDRDWIKVDIGAEAEPSRPKLARKITDFTETGSRLTHRYSATNVWKHQERVASSTDSFKPSWFTVLRVWIDWHIMRRSHTKTSDDRMMVFHLHRPGAPLHFILLGIEGWLFWLLIAIAQALLLVACAAMFRVSSSLTRGRVVRLALATHGLAQAELECPPSEAACIVVGAVFAYLQQIYLLVVGALAIVRIFRETTRDRFVFSKVAVVANGELRVRLASNRPSVIVHPVFIMTVQFRESKQLLAIPLSNGGDLAYLHDTPMLLRHAVDANSPFSSPTWQHDMSRLSVSVEGYDECLAQTVSGRQSYSFHKPGGVSYQGNCVVGGHDYEDMITGNHRISFGNRDHNVLTVDHSKLHQTNSDEFGMYA
jgi:hypothetical protein